MTEERLNQLKALDAEMRKNRGILSEEEMRQLRILRQEKAPAYIEMLDRFSEDTGLNTSISSREK